jgi:hypothetical protein
MATKHTWTKYGGRYKRDRGPKYFPHSTGPDRLFITDWRESEDPYKPRYSRPKHDALVYRMHLHRDELKRLRGRATAQGWEIVCPDGKVRLYTYPTYQWAARVATRCSDYHSGPYEDEDPCPQGEHTVRKCYEDRNG